MGRRRGRQATPATVMLTRAGAAFEVHQYEHDAAAASYGIEAADALGVPYERVFKTLVAEVDDALIVAGYVAGGISPLGLRRSLPTVVDDSALAQESVYVSAGRRGLDIELSPADLIRVTRAVTAPIAQERR